MSRDKSTQSSRRTEPARGEWYAHGRLLLDMRFSDSQRADLMPISD